MRPQEETEERLRNKVFLYSQVLEMGGTAGLAMPRGEDTRMVRRQKTEVNHPRAFIGVSAGRQGKA